MKIVVDKILKFTVKGQSDHLTDLYCHLEFNIDIMLTETGNIFVFTTSYLISLIKNFINLIFKNFDITKCGPTIQF